MIKLNSTCKGRSNAKRLKRRARKRKKNGSGEMEIILVASGEHFVLPIWPFCACVLINLLRFPSSPITPMHMICIRSPLWRSEWVVEEEESASEAASQMSSMASMWFYFAFSAFKVTAAESRGKNNLLEKMCNKMALILLLHLFHAPSYASRTCCTIGIRNGCCWGAGAGREKEIY